MQAEKHRIEPTNTKEETDHFHRKVILGTCLKIMSNDTNHVTQTPLDHAFAPNAWKDPMQHAA